MLFDGLAPVWAPVLEVEFWHVFQHVIEYLCEKEVFKKWCFEGRVLACFSTRN